MARQAKQCGVPDYLVGKMVTTPSNDMYWLTTQDLFAMDVSLWQNGWKLSPQDVQKTAKRQLTQPQYRRNAAFLQDCGPWAAVSQGITRSTASNFGGNFRK
jgi:hypothetical protein